MHDRDRERKPFDYDAYKAFKRDAGSDDRSNWQPMDHGGEVERIMTMSDEEVLADVRRQGLDPEQIAAEGRAAFERACATVDENMIKRSKDE